MYFRNLLEASQLNIKQVVQSLNHSMLFENQNKNLNSHGSIMGLNFTITLLKTGWKKSRYQDAFY